MSITSDSSANVPSGGSKVCPKCQAEKPVEAFSRDGKRKDGRQYACKACNKRYRTDNREHCNQVVVDWYRRTGWEHRLGLLYGVPPGWYAEKLASQGGGCAICGEEPPEGKHLVVDHDHQCCPEARSTQPTCGKCVRGLVCAGCNSSLGHLERPAWRIRADEYLRSWSRE